MPLLKSDGLPCKTCDRCKCTDTRSIEISVKNKYTFIEHTQRHVSSSSLYKKYRDKHKEQVHVYWDQYYLDNQDKIKEYREVNKDKIREQRKQFYENNKDKINAKNSERITCECGCTSRRDKISQHKKSSCHQKLMEQKNKLKRDLTDEELDVFFRTNYTFQNYPKGILTTSYAQTI